MVLEVYCFQKRAFLLPVHRRNRRIGKTKTDKMVFSIEDLVLIKVHCQEKGFDNHTASLERTVNVHESVLSRKLVF